MRRAPAGRRWPTTASSRVLKKPSVAFSAPPLARRDSLVAHISNGLQPFEMAAHPWAARRLPKDSVFQQPARSVQVMFIGAPSPAWDSRTSGFAEEEIHDLVFSQSPRPSAPEVEAHELA